MDVGVVSIIHIIALTLVGIGLSIVFTARRYPPPIRGSLEAYGHGKLIAVVGFVVGTMRDPSDLLWSAPIANGLVTAGVFLNLTAIRRLRGRAGYGYLSPLAGLIVAAGCAAMIEMGPFGLAGARLVSGGVVAVIMALVTVEVLVLYRGPGVSHLIVGGISAMMALILAYRIVTILNGGVVTPVDGPMIDDPSERMVFAYQLVGTVIAAINFVLMASDQFNRELTELASTDAMTGVLNRRRFLELAEKEFRRARRFEHEMSLLVFDIDHFKRINDTRGHQVGDQVIVAVAETIARGVREGEPVGRIGGEEFAVVLLETGRDEAALVAERLRVAIAALSSGFDPRHPIDVACSVGVASLDERHRDLNALIGEADVGLYAAKNAGRNRVGWDTAA